MALGTQQVLHPSVCITLSAICMSPSKAVCVYVCSECVTECVLRVVRVCMCQLVYLSFQPLRHQPEALQLGRHRCCFNLVISASLLLAFLVSDFWTRLKVSLESPVLWPNINLSTLDFSCTCAFFPHAEGRMCLCSHSLA